MPVSVSRGSLSSLWLPLSSIWFCARARAQGVPETNRGAGLFRVKIEIEFFLAQSVEISKEDESSDKTEDYSRREI